MNYEEARADLDDLVVELAKPANSSNYSQRCNTLRTLAIISRRALRATAGIENEAEHRHEIEAVLDRIKSMLATTEQLEKLKEIYRH